MVETVPCVHCGAVTKYPVYKTIQGQPLAFCCGGCVEVYEMMHEEGFESGQGVPENTQILQSVAAHPNSNQSNESASSQTFSYHVTGMTCANCAAAVTRQLRSVPGVLEVSVVLETERAAVKMIPTRVSMADLKRAVEKAGYDISL